MQILLVSIDQTCGQIEQMSGLTGDVTLIKTHLILFTVNKNEPLVISKITA